MIGLSKVKTSFPVKKTIERDLPLPWVCQTTPPFLSPLLPFWRSLCFKGTTLYNSQKKSLKAAEAYSESKQLQRYDYWHQIKDIKVEDLVFLDETGVNKRND